MGMTTAELQSLPLFGDCAEDDLRAVADAITAERDVAEGDVICAEGEKADRWWIVTDGTADVTVGGLYTATIGPGETIGELALLDGEPRAATVKAVTEMRVYEVDGHAFVDALVDHPRLALAMLREIAARLRVTNLRPAPPAIRATRTTSRATAGLPTIFDPREPEFYDDPAAYYAACREDAAVHWSDAIASYVVTRYEDVFRLSRSRALRGSITLPLRGELSNQPIAWRIVPFGMMGS